MLSTQIYFEKTKESGGSSGGGFHKYNSTQFFMC